MFFLQTAAFPFSFGRFGRSFSFSAAAHALWAQSRDGPKHLGTFCEIRPSPQGPVLKWDPYYLWGSTLITNLMVSFREISPLKKVHCVWVGLVENDVLHWWNKDLPTNIPKKSTNSFPKVFSCFEKRDLASLSTFLFNNSLKLRNRTSKMMVGTTREKARKWSPWTWPVGLWDDEAMVPKLRRPGEARLCGIGARYTWTVLQ